MLRRKTLPRNYIDPRTTLETRTVTGGSANLGTLAKGKPHSYENQTSRALFNYSDTISLAASATLLITGQTNVHSSYHHTPPFPTPACILREEGEAIGDETMGLMQTKD